MAEKDVCSRFGKVSLEELRVKMAFPAEIVFEYDHTIENQECLDNSHVLTEQVGFLLVGHGSAREKCGEVNAELHCDHCGHKETRHLFINHCDRPVCPTCWKNWRSRLVKKSSDRLDQLMRCLVEENENYRMHHVSWSPSSEMYGLTYKQLRRKFHYMLKMAGAVAGAVVFHPFRFRDAVTGERVNWRNCHLNPDAEDPIVHSKVIWSPHFHTLCVGYLMSSDEFHKRFPTWTYTKYRELCTKDAMMAVLNYQLSHAGINKVHHTLTYFGRFSYNQTKSLKERLEPEPINCDVCGKQLTKVWLKDVMVDDRPVAGYREPAWMKQTKMVYWLKPNG